jgi:heme/copper-type cytochrome/quinol oxidase subunit 2
MPMIMINIIIRKKRKRERREQREQREQRERKVKSKMTSVPMIISVRKILLSFFP